MDGVDARSQVRTATGRPLRPKCVGPFKARAITTSSNAALPARSPMPLIVHSICLARAMGRACDTRLAVDEPLNRSGSALVENTTLSAFSPKPSRSCWIRGPNSQGTFQPVVSGC